MEEVKGWKEGDPLAVRLHAQDSLRRWASEAFGILEV